MHVSFFLPIWMHACMYVFSLYFACMYYIGYVFMCVCVCVCGHSNTFVWRHEREQGMRRVEHVRAPGLGSLRGSLTPQLPLSPATTKIARKARNRAASVFLFIRSFYIGKEVCSRSSVSFRQTCCARNLPAQSKARKARLVSRARSSVSQGLVAVCRKAA